jgi:hypothetical protein
METLSDRFRNVSETPPDTDTEIIISANALIAPAESEIPIAPRQLTPQQEMVGAIGEVCRMDWHIKANASRIGKTAAELLKAGYTPENVTNFGKWWLTDKWRADNVPVPNLAQVTEKISQGAHYQNGNGQRASPERADPPSQVRMREFRKAQESQGNVWAAEV